MCALNVCTLLYSTKRIWLFVLHSVLLHFTLRTAIVVWPMEIPLMYP